MVGQNCTYLIDRGADMLQYSSLHVIPVCMRTHAKCVKGHKWHAAGSSACV